jgi:hypothetical protein
MRRVILAAFAAAACHADEMNPEVMKEALALQAEAFEEFSLPGDGKTATFEVKLGEKAAKMENELFDGFRFRCPELPEGTDFVWYFNAPRSWGNWYIFPVEGKPGQAFRNWLDGDKLYEPFDESGAKDRLRILQTLEGGYFESGREYIMWFRRTGDGGGDNTLRGIAVFAASEKSWDHDDIEKALKLKPAPAAAQVAELKSRGGEILLDKEFFHPAYAAGRIDSAFDSIRSTKRLSGGFFITMQISVPPCTTEPSLEAIAAKHGKPDFIRTGEELAKVRKAAGGSPPDADAIDTTIHYYDHFGFEVESGTADPKVLRVVTAGANFAELRPPEKGSSYARLDLENVVVFHKEGTEVGRAYYFLEGEKTPVFTKEPPSGEYTSGEDRLIGKGRGEWIWESRFKDGKIARRMPLKSNQLHGKAEGFHENGQPRFVAEYRKGILDGTLVQYNEAGKEVSRRTFKDGEEEGTADEPEE